MSQEGQALKKGESCLTPFCDKSTTGLLFSRELLFEIAAGSDLDPGHNRVASALQSCFRQTDKRAQLFSKMSCQEHHTCLGVLVQLQCSAAFSLSRGHQCW